MPPATVDCDASAVSSHALRPTLHRIKRHSLSHRRRRTVAVAGELISVAGIVGSPVYDEAGRRVGSLHDLVIRWDAGEPRPPLWGVVLRSRFRQAFVPASALAALMPDSVRLTKDFEPRPVEREAGLVALAHDVLDRQIVDAGGADIARVSDLALGLLPDGIRLVGADVSARTLLRRLGPATLRRRVAPERVYDWAGVAAFSVRGPGEAGSVLRLTAAAAQLGALHPDELATLLGDLPPAERAQLAAHVAGEPAR
jgi:sporulation protein YlmC with PRC-barrel domain